MQIFSIYTGDLAIRIFEPIIESANTVTILQPDPNQGDNADERWLTLSITVHIGGKFERDDQTYGNRFGVVSQRENKKRGTYNATIFIPMLVWSQCYDACASAEELLKDCLTTVARSYVIKSGLQSETINKPKDDVLLPLYEALWGTRHNRVSREEFERLRVEGIAARLITEVTG